MTFVSGLNASLNLMGCELVSFPLLLGTFFIRRERKFIGPKSYGYDTMLGKRVDKKLAMSKT